MQQRCPAAACPLRAVSTLGRYSHVLEYPAGTRGACRPALSLPFKAAACVITVMRLLEPAGFRQLRFAFRESLTEARALAVASTAPVFLPAPRTPALVLCAALSMGAKDEANCTLNDEENCAATTVPRVEKHLPPSE